jgi:hypothetical protein
MERIAMKQTCRDDLEQLEKKKPLTLVSAVSI